MHFLVTQQQNFQAHFKWPEEEYVSSLLTLIVSLFSYIFVRFVKYIAFLMHLKILADAMGLGKTIMTIALLVAHSGHGPSGSQPISRSSFEDIEASDMSDHSSKLPKAVTKFSGFHKLMKQKNTLAYGGSLIVCPMTLLGQWKVIKSIS